MSQTLYTKNRQILEGLMQRVGISSFAQLSELSGLSQWQLVRLEYGLLAKMSVETLLKLSNTLKMSIHELLSLFCTDVVVPTPVEAQLEDSSLELETLKQEYQRLQSEMEQQRETLIQDYQRLQVQMEQERTTLIEDYQRLQLQIEQQQEISTQSNQRLQQEIEHQQDTSTQDHESLKIQLEQQREAFTQEYQELELQMQQQQETFTQEYQELELQMQQQREAFTQEYQNLELQMQQQQEAFTQEYQNLELQMQQQQETFTQEYQNLELQMQQQQEAFTQEYQNLELQMQQQRETLLQEFQSSSLHTLESWLIQWPSAAIAAHKNRNLPAIKLLPLLKPIATLLKQWGVEPLVSIGEKVAYDPQYHQLLEGTAEPGDLVQVRYMGYRQRDKLLYRAKVSPILPQFNPQSDDQDTVLDLSLDPDLDDSPETVLDV